MASRELIAYIQSLLRNGYHEQHVRTYLLRVGYSTAQIEEAFGALSHETALATGPPPRPPWLWITGAVLGLGLGGLLVALLFAAPTVELALLSSPAQLDIRAGDLLDITDQVTADDERVTLIHTMLDPNTNTPVSFPEESTIFVSGTQQHKTSLRVPPGLRKGRYEVEVRAINSKGEEKKATFPVSISQAVASCTDSIQNQGEEGLDCGGPCAACPSIEAPVTPPAPPASATIPDCPSGCDDLDSTTDDLCIQGECVHKAREALCGDSICNAGETAQVCPEDCGAGPTAPSADEVIEDARQAASTNSDRAMALCAALPRPSDKDRCYSVVAADSGKSNICAAIGEDITRDQCYIDFALSKNEFAVCEKIINRYLRGSCNSLRNLRLLEQKRAQEEQPAADVVTAVSVKPAPGGQFACQTQRPTTCPSEAALVCGENGKTYTNSCMACQDLLVNSYTVGAC